SKMIDKYKCGFYVDDNSCKSIKETILLIKDNKQLRDDMGSNSKRLAEELDRYGMADRLEEVFKRYVKN
ncbi:MAG: glycosyltransferase, partial [Acetivibrionales bacterium]